MFQCADCQEHMVAVYVATDEATCLQTRGIAAERKFIAAREAQRLHVWKCESWLSRLPAHLAEQLRKVPNMV